MSRVEKFVALVAALTIAVMSPSAFADWGYSLVNPPPISEASHTDILTDIYSQNFIASGEDYLGDNRVNAYRAWDFDEEKETIHILTGDQSGIDQIWTDGIATVTAEAKYAGLDQSFGWNRGEGGGLATNYYELLTHADVGNGPVEIEISGSFLWGTQPNSDEWWSKESLNIDSASDHLVTYYIDGASINGEIVWLLFWEDLPSTGGWDQDYNDFVVEVRASPEPATIILLGLGGLLLRKRK